MIPDAANHSISSKNGAPTGTSGNDASAGASNPTGSTTRNKNAAIAWRDTGATGPNVPSG